MKNIAQLYRRFPTLGFVFTCIGFFIYALTMILIIIVLAVAFTG
jgi:hypothetical protein